jgi:malate/lactate dehydrogenase
MYERLVLRRTFRWFVMSELHDYAGKVIILTNPVDIFTVLVKEWIPTADVYGLGVTMDAARLAYCAQRQSIECFANDCPLGGAHIGKLVQLRSLWNRQSPIFAQAEVAVDELLRSASRIGPAIVRGLGFTLHDCVAVFGKDVAWLVGKDTTREYLCASVGDDASAAAWPLKLSEKTGRCEIADDLPDKEVRQLESAGKLVADAVDIVRRGAVLGYRL